MRTVRRAASLLLLLPIVALGGCENIEPTGPAPSIESISVTPESVTLSVDSTTQLEAEVATTGGADPTVSWGSADSEVATVAPTGDRTIVVAGVSEGQTTVTATAVIQDGDSESASASVTVQETGSTDDQ